MRQIILIVSVMLLGLSWAVAQNESTQSTPNSGSQSGMGSETQSNSSYAGSGRATQSGSQTTVEGCLSGSNGNFTLSDKNGMTYQLTGDTAKLSEHVGHEVKITGMSSSGGSAGSNSDSAGAGAGSGQTLQVSSVKHVSKTCKSGGMAH